MKKIALFGFALLAGFAVAARAPVLAQASASPAQLQALIANGHEQAALSQLQAVLQAHPDSGVAWYLTAEAQDASGNEAAARTALANAEQYSPGLPFAQPNDVAALQAHLSGSIVQQPRRGISPILVIVGLVVLFMLFRLFSPRRRYMVPPGYQGGYGPGPGGPFPYGSGGPGMGIGGSLLGGLVAGAGFAAGERVIDGMMGGQGGGFIDPASGQGGVPDRDDGLTGSPGWDAGSDPNGGGGFDPGNNW